MHYMYIALIGDLNIMKPKCDEHVKDFSHWNICKINIFYPTVFVAPPDPEDHDLNKLEYTLYQKAFL
jgi:hypothetical protein